MKWRRPAQCYLPVAPHVSFINRWMNLDKSSKFLCFPLFAFPSHLSSAALHHSPPNPTPFSPSQPMSKPRVKPMSFPQAVNQSCKLKPCSQCLTRHEKGCVCTHACNCACMHVKSLPSRQGLHLVAEGVESLRGNLPGNGSKLQVFSSFNFFISVSTPSLCVQRCIFFPLWSRVLLLTGTRLNYRSYLCLV